MKKPNIIILIIDTLREDYSSGLETLRELGFVKYENAIAPAPWTLPSHASLITGMYPSQHEIHESRSARTNEELANIAKVKMRQLNYGIIGELKDEGYETRIITANPYVTKVFGFAADDVILTSPFVVFAVSLSQLINQSRFFELLNNVYNGDRVKMFLDLTRRGELRDAITSLVYYLLNKMMHAYRQLLRLGNWLGIHDLTMEKGSEWTIRILSKLKFPQPFFLIINIMEAHSPYLRNDLNDKLYNETIAKWIINNGTDDPIVEELRKSYPRHAAYAVKRAVEIIMALKPYLDDSLVIVTSDHGELLGDGGLGHGYFLRDGLLRVPLWVKWPSWVKPPKQVGPFVSLTQIPSIIRAVIDNEEPRVGSSAAVSESFGIAPYHLVDVSKLNYEKALKLLTHRIRVYTRHGTATYNVNLEEFEEINGDEDELMKITRTLINYLNSPGVVPTED
jgi:hypothetical protein